MSILRFIELDQENEQHFKHFLQFYNLHFHTTLSQLQKLGPKVAVLLTPGPDGASTAAGPGSLERGPLEPYLNELRTRGQRFVDDGGQVTAWLHASQLFRRSVLAQLDSLRAVDGESAQSVMSGMFLFLDILTMAITQRSLEQLHTETHIRLAFEAAPTGLVIADKHGIIRFCNAETDRLFGYSRDELVGQSIDLLVPPRFRSAHTEHRTSYIQNPSSRMMGAGRDLYGLRKDGSEFPVEIGLNPSRSHGSGAVLAVIADISARKQAQEELVTKMWELQRSNEDLEQFAYVASHDLQEPLRQVVSYTTLLSERYRGKLDEKADKFIRYAVEGATRMQRLIADLLAYSRVGSQGTLLKPVNAQVILNNTLDGMRQSIEEAQAQISHDSLPTVMADEVQLAQLFQNLIGNALKFHASGQVRVHISAQPRDGKWLFAIRDNGIGIEKEHQERIFQMFQRLHERGKYEGSGIGLTIAKKIVERHRGRIWVESQPGQGSTFYFTLPAPALERR